MGNKDNRVNVYYYDGDEERKNKVYAGIILLLLSIYTLVKISSNTAALYGFLILYIPILSLLLISRRKQGKRITIKSIISDIGLSFITTIVVIVLFILLYAIIMWIDVLHKIGAI